MKGASLQQSGQARNFREGQAEEGAPLMIGAIREGSFSGSKSPKSTSCNIKLKLKL